MALVAEEILRAVADEAMQSEEESAPTSELQRLFAQVVPLQHGRRLSVDEDESRLEITTREGEIELRVEITPTGPLLRFESANLALRSAGELDLECDELNLRSRGDTRLACGGDFQQRVSGNHSVAVRDDARFTAQAIDMVAELGDLALEANDDVALDGLRVLMNVPSEEEVARRRAAAKSFADYLALPAIDEKDAGRLPRSTPKARPDWRDE